MSTRSTTHFKHGDELVAIVYRHTDGYPDGAGADICGFLDQCASLSDSRFSDPSYLAAKYVVFLADKFNWTHSYKAGPIRPQSKLEFLSVGVVMEDPGDIEYRYEVDCAVSPRPKVRCFERHGDWDNPTWRELPWDTTANASDVVFLIH
jgi:hypothetical protein